MKIIWKKIEVDFWRYPNRLYAMRATISMCVLSIPLIVAHMPFYGVTLALGALAGALSETDDHPKGRIKALSLTLVCFFAVSFLFGALSNTPVLLGVFFVVSTIIFILLGGVGYRYRTITFGSILVGIYTLLGLSISPAWYWQAILLTAGALFHGLLTLALMFHKPWRLLDEQLASGFINLSKYLKKKAKLFPSNNNEQAIINNDLALLNVDVVNSLERIKAVINNYSKEIKNEELLRPYLQRFMLLQSLHERAASSHEPHDELSNAPKREEVLMGFAEMLRQLAYSAEHLAECLLTGQTYNHPVSLEWISEAIENKLSYMDADNAQHLILLHHNLYRSHLSLKYLDNEEKGTSIPRLKKDDTTTLQLFKTQLSFQNPRFRHAIRLSICFAIGFALMQHFALDKGAWIMLTSLFVSQISYAETRRRLYQRVIGTISGIVLGVVLNQIFITTTGQVLLFTASAFAFFYWLRTEYSLSVVFITIFVICAFNIILADVSLDILLPRLLYTLLGALLSFIVIRILLPDWQYKRIPKLINTAMKKNATYLTAVLNEYEYLSTDDLTYRIARREAHLADSDLVQAWNSMRIEPKDKRKLLQKAFTLTYLNHALLSYVSALGAHRESTKIEIKNITDMSNQIIDALNQTYTMELSTLLLKLKQQIVTTEDVIPKQQLRLFYNIASTTTKITNELKNDDYTT